MPRPWQIVDRVMTDEGAMTLMQQGEAEFIIRMDEYILMSSHYHLSEADLGRSACQALAGRRRPTVLVAGLGMGFTLRAALDALPAGARVTVAELNPVVVDWCKNQLSHLTDAAVEDPRVDLRVTDVAALISRAARAERPYDAIVLDLYQGTHDANKDPEHPFFGRPALERTRRALTRDGVLAVWTEERDPGFEKRLRTVGFEFERHRPGKGVPRHVVYIATRSRSRPVRTRRPKRGRRG